MYVTLPTHTSPVLLGDSWAEQFCSATIETNSKLHNAVCWQIVDDSPLPVPHQSTLDTAGHTRHCLLNTQNNVEWVTPHSRVKELLENIITYQEAQCLGPEAPRLYEGRSPDHQKSQLEWYELHNHTFLLGRVARENREVRRDWGVREWGSMRKCVEYKHTAQLTPNSLISLATFCSLSWERLMMTTFSPCLASWKWSNPQIMCVTDDTATHTVMYLQCIPSSYTLRRSRHHWNERWNGNMGIRPAVEWKHGNWPTHLPMVHISWGWFVRCPTERGRRHRTHPTTATCASATAWAQALYPPLQQYSCRGGK